MWHFEKRVTGWLVRTKKFIFWKYLLVKYCDLPESPMIPALNIQTNNHNKWKNTELLFFWGKQHKVIFGGNSLVRPRAVKMKPLSHPSKEYLLVLGMSRISIRPWFPGGCRMNNCISTTALLQLTCTVIQMLLQLV